MRYNIRHLLEIVALVAVACFVVFAAPPIIRLTVLIVAVLVLPAPLAVLLRSGGPITQAFALGGLVSYAAWMALGGAACAYLMAHRLKDTIQIQVEAEDMVNRYYAGYLGLYVPLIIVPLSGAIAMFVQRRQRSGH